MKPTLAPEALHGLPGEFVRTVAPYSEADPAALLASFLATFGCYVGPSPRIIAGGVHTARLHVLIVGRSAKARKGSSRFPVTQVFERVDPTWTAEQVLGGFGSGEAVVAVAATSDPKVLVTEEEFGRLLAVAARQGSTISQLLRSAWDDGKLESRRRGDSEVVVGAHISLLAHITVGELLEKLAASDLSGGTVNRLLMIAAGRSKRLAHGAAVPDVELDRLAKRTRRAVDEARRIGRMRYTPDGAALWEAMYDHLADDDPPGKLGDAIARAEPQVLRLSIAYAAADGTAEIDVPHLAAAYSVWRYARDTAASIFPSDPLSPDERKLLTAVVGAGDAGLTGTQRSEVFQRHRTAQQLAAMVHRLDRLGFVATRSVPTEGRPAEVVVATANGERGAESEQGSALTSPLPALRSLVSLVRNRAGEAA
jgi:hypothetical protein